jgi:hypothetical protein
VDSTGEAWNREGQNLESKTAEPDASNASETVESQDDSFFEE